jgi:hypothetical protein
VCAACHSASLVADRDDGVPARGGTEPQQASAEQRATGFARNNAVEEKAVPVPAATPAAKVEESKVHLGRLPKQWWAWRCPRWFRRRERRSPGEYRPEFRGGRGGSFEGGAPGAITK